MAYKQIRQTRHNRQLSDSTAIESTPELDSDDDDEDTDPENFIRNQSTDEEPDHLKEQQSDEDKGADDFAIYTDDEDSPNFYTNNNDEDIGLTVSEGDEENTPQPHYMPSVINYMPSQSPEEEEEEEEETTSTSHPSDEDDDSSIEQEEEDLIQDEFDDAVENAENDQESSDSEDDFYDFFDSGRHRQEPQQPVVEEDDSYLWEYFLSSDSENDTPHHEQENSLIQLDAQAQQEMSGESTDEEANLPIPSKRASNNRAVEVLGANSHMRPPVLGSWNIENATGNVGIIDGLTTRTLSPPPQDEDMDAGNQSWLSESDGDDEAAAVQMDEFINTDELDFDEENDEESSYLTTPSVYRSRFNKNVPLSAFRNRSSPYTHNNYDQTFRRRRRSFSQPTTSNAIISPIRSLRKRPKQRAPRRHNQQQHKPEDFGGENMLEFYELGNMTPLFEI